MFKEREGVSTEGVFVLERMSARSSNFGGELGCDAKREESEDKARRRGVGVEELEF